MGDDWRGWKNGKYDNRYKGVKRRNKNNKTIIGVIIGIVILSVGVYAYANYDITIANQKVNDLIPVESIQKSVEKTANDIATTIPVKIEPKSDNTKNKLEDCSIYKNEIQDRTDMDEAYMALQKTNACEQRNKQIETEQAFQSNETTQNYPAVNVVMGKNRGITADFKINKVGVVDSDNYKIIYINMLMSLHMKLQDRVSFQPTFDWELKSPSGQLYREKCHGKGFDLMTITGEQNQNLTWNICYHVEKELNNFDLMYSKNKIGTIILK